jgi:uncharacterized membrane protein YbhN (UPF0104 family)
MSHDEVDSSEDETGTRPGKLWSGLTNLDASGRYYRPARLLIALVWVLALSLLAWLAWRSRDTLILYLAGANYWRLLLALPFYLGTIVASVIGWSFIMRLFERPVSLWTHFRIYCATLAARRLPGTIWYVGGRLVLYHQLGLSRKAVSVASAVELFVTAIAGIAVGLLSLSLGLSLPAHIIVLLLAGAIGGSLCLHPAVLGAVMRWLKRPLVRTVAVMDILTWMLAYSVAWLMGGLMLGQIISAFWPLEGRQLVLVIGAWALSGTGGLLTIFLPSSFGVTELALTFFFARLMPLPLAVTVAVLARILTTLAEVILSIGSYAFLRLSHGLKVEPASDSMP